MKFQPAATVSERIAAAGKLWKRLAPKGYAMKEAELKVDLAVMGDEVIGTSAGLGAGG